MSSETGFYSFGPTLFAFVHRRAARDVNDIDNNDERIKELDAGGRDASS